MFFQIEHKVSLLQQINNHIEQSVFLRKNKHDQFKKRLQWNFICSNYGNDQHWSAILFLAIVKVTMWFDCGKGKQEHFSQTHEHDLSQKVETYKRKAPDQRCFLFTMKYCFILKMFNFLCLYRMFLKLFQQIKSHYHFFYMQEQNLW